MLARRLEAGAIYTITHWATDLVIVPNKRKETKKEERKMKKNEKAFRPCLAKQQGPSNHKMQFDVAVLPLAAGLCAQRRTCARGIASIQPVPAFSKLVAAVPMRVELEEFGALAARFDAVARALLAANHIFQVVSVALAVAGPRLA